MKRRLCSTSRLSCVRGLVCRHYERRLRLGKGEYKGITDTTRTLLNYWFYSDHKLKTGRPFRYHASQQEAIETLIYVWEVEKIRNRKDLLEKYAQNTPDLRLAQYDEFARYCTKMATGSGKTKVMALAIAWQWVSQKGSGENCRFMV